MIWSSNSYLNKGYGTVGDGWPPEPWEEDIPRMPEPFASEIFYYAQYDVVAKPAADRFWECSHLPGFVPQHISQSLRLFLSYYRSVKGLGAECVFPGTPEAWTTLRTGSSQDLVARFHIHVSLLGNVTSRRSFNLGYGDAATYRAFKFVDTFWAEGRAVELLSDEFSDRGPELLEGGAEILRSCDPHLMTGRQVRECLVGCFIEPFLFGRMAGQEVLQHREQHRMVKQILVGGLQLQLHQTPVKGIVIFLEAWKERHKLLQTLCSILDLVEEKNFKGTEGLVVGWRQSGAGMYLVVELVVLLFDMFALHFDPFPPVMTQDFTMDPLNHDHGSLIFRGFL
ncbi:hypothetical protein HG530_012599 [Fusarium avenaceum]|nr:hypothetical protein HG530_012599 [Fusarium avenaceum]